MSASAAPAQLSVGRLRHRIRVEQPIQVKDSDGQVSTQWEAIPGGINNDGVFWAEIRGMTSRELLASQQITPQMNMVITMRFNAAVTAKMRGVHIVDGHDRTVYNFAQPIQDAYTGTEWMTIPATAFINEG